MAPAIAVEIALSEGENQTLERKEGPVHSNRLLIDATVCPAMSSGNRPGSVISANRVNHQVHACKAYQIQHI